MDISIKLGSTFAVLNHTILRVVLNNPILQKNNSNLSHGFMGSYPNKHVRQDDTAFGKNTF